jgi:hypothetical protein
VWGTSPAAHARMPRDRRRSSVPSSRKGFHSVRKNITSTRKLVPSSSKSSACTPTRLDGATPSLKEGEHSQAPRSSDKRHFSTRRRSPIGVPCPSQPPSSRVDGLAVCHLAARGGARSSAVLNSQRCVPASHRRTSHITNQGTRLRCVSKPASCRATPGPDSRPVPTILVRAVVQDLVRVLVDAVTAKYLSHG